MKHLCALGLLLLIFTTSIHAQLSENGWLLGGNFSFARSTEDNSFTSIQNTSGVLFGELPNAKSFEYSFQFQFGYMLNNSLAVGLKAGFMQSDTENILFFNDFSGGGLISLKQISESEEYLIGPFLRYYKPFKNPKFGFQMEIVSGFSSGNSEIRADQGGAFSVSTTDTKIESTGWEVGVFPGLYYFINSRIFLDASIAGIGYKYVSSEITGAIIDNSIFPLDERTIIREQKTSDFEFFLVDAIGLRLGLNVFFGADSASGKQSTD